MGKFLESEKPKQAEFKASAPYFSDLARRDGKYKGKTYPFCLPAERAEENLFPDIREAALAHFNARHIQWHDGKNGKPSNHLCSSQVCCVNFLLPFALQPDALAQVLRPVFPELDHMLPVEDGLYVTFEWIGEKDYLCEQQARNGRRTRGANTTSADAIVMFERKDHQRQIVLIEWKYTEVYGGTNLKLSHSNTDRSGKYRKYFDRVDCPIDKELLPGFDALFYEPFYQFMRQQFLAHEMELEQEAGANFVTLLHIAPTHNTDFRKVTSPELKGIGETATSTWKRLVRPEGKFISVSSEQLFGDLSANQLPEMRTWIEYIYARYAWVHAS